MAASFAESQYQQLEQKLLKKHHEKKGFDPGESFYIAGALA